MKRFLTFVLFAVMTTTLAKAMPARPGRWMTLPLDGRMVSAQLVGDEHLHYWLTNDGLQLMEQDGCFVRADMAQMRSRAQERRQKAARSRQKRVRRTANEDFSNYTGKKKGIIILVEFENCAFLPENDSLLYTRICNEENFSEGRFHGSVRDYFLAQSYGLFDLTFDVVGPVPLSKTYQYYGRNDSNGEDMRPGEMVVEACNAVDDYVDFSRYDWDGDGYVDQVMCIYAGKGENSNGSSSTIWPHEWQLDESDYGELLYLDDVAINTYAASNELSGSSIDGLGTICHEFSHCLGLPDMYDINYKGNYGMGSWSVLDNGSYNGNGFRPAGYTSFERYSCGWLQPTVLDANTTVDAMQPLNDAPQAYMIVNDAWPDEYYLLENRQPRGWDASLPGSGMLILHVDYDADIWEYNFVNTNNMNPADMEPANDHQRCTVFKANQDISTYYSSESGVAYPYLKRDSLTSTSTPAATVYNKNVDGTNLMGKSVLDITRNSDGTMAFRFRNDKEDVPTAILDMPHDGGNGGACFTPAGRYVGKTSERLHPGLYIQRDDKGQRGRTVIIK